MSISTDIDVRSFLTGDTSEAAAVLSWEDVCYKVRVGSAGQLRQILTDISGIAGAPAATAATSPTNGGGSSHGINGGAANSGTANGYSAGDAAAANGDRGCNGNGSSSRYGGRKGGGGAGSSASGGMCAILGPSGAGKTTLLDILAGRRYGAGARFLIPDAQHVSLVGRLRGRDLRLSHWQMERSR